MAVLFSLKICRWFVISIALCLMSSHVVKSDRITEKIYKKIDQGFSCFRRLNGTHQIGCSSRQSGNVGVVHLVENAADIDWLVQIGSTPPYTVLMWPDVFRRDNVVKLQNSGKVSGIVVLNGTSPTRSTPVSYSNDFSCPNKYSSLYKNELASQCDANPWNPPGDGLLFDNIDFPVFFINETKFNQSVLLDDCFYKFNQPQNGSPPSYPLCSIELKAFMWASVDTPTCLRRGRLNMLFNPQPSEYCDPLGSFNVFVPLLPTNKSEGETRNRSVIVVAARMDSASIFDGLALGADTAITGAAALIAVAEMLHRAKPDMQKSQKIDNVFLVLFQGEAFDYIGSSRMVYDMVNKKFPRPLKDDQPSQGPLVSLEHLSHFIELGSLAPHGDSTIYAHVDPLSTGDSGVQKEVDRLIEKLQGNQEGKLTVEGVDRTVPLPPSSFQSFLKKDTAIPGVVITNHKGRFTNRYYNSEWDSPQAIDMITLSRHLANVARTVSATVYQLATGQTMPATYQPNITFVNEVVECYVINGNCTLFNQLLNFKSPLYAAGPLTTYVGVEQADDAYKPLVTRTRNLMALVAGEVVASNRTDCFGNETDEIYHYYWMGESELENITGQCYKTTVKTSSAVSPAFEIEDYDWKSGEYPSWTESRWETFAMRIFLKPSPTQEWTVFCVGLVVFLFSIVLTYWVNSKAHVLFPHRGSEGVC